MEKDGTPLEPLETYSAVTLRMISAKDDFLLRDDIEPTASPSHVLDMKMAYLIGEHHDRKGDRAGTSRWATELAQLEPRGQDVGDARRYA